MRSLLPVFACALALILTGCRAPAESVAEAAVAQAATATSRATATRAPTDTPTATPTFTPTALPTATPTLTPTATPVPPPQAIRLTDGGCCTQPFWSPDSTQVRFIDKPAPDAKVGIYGVTVVQPGSAPAFVSERVADSQATGDFRVETGQNTTTIFHLSDGTSWTVPARGRNVIFSPDGTRIAWSAVNNDDLPPDRQVTTVWIASLDGSNARHSVATLPRGGLSGWVTKDSLLVNGRENGGAREQVLSVLNLGDGSLRELARADRLRSPTLSPSGRWVAYYTTFLEDATQNGLWLVSTAGGPPQMLPRELFGAYQWRGCDGPCSEESDRLLIVPLQPDAEFHQLWQVTAPAGADDAAQLVTLPLTDPAVTPFKIANGDWRVSPDGRYIVFVESRDRNIWVLELPTQPE